MTPPAAAARSTARTAPARRPAPRPRAVPAPTRRRVSGPGPGARSQARPVPGPRPAVSRSTPGTLLDRVIRGRLWIVLLATALLGLVFLQISLLKLNSGIGRAVQTSATLERQNAMLRSEVSRLDAGERIQTAATGLGLVMPAPGDRNYLAVRPGDARLAAKAITAPAPVVQQALAPDPVTGVAPSVADPATQAQAPVTTTAAPPVAQAAAAPAPTATPTPQATVAPQPPAADPTAGGVSADPAAG